MGCDVFANNNEIACKKGGGKVIAEFPDVCLSPPSPPAGPLPVPYPNTSFSKDMKSGSKTVKIKGGEVMLKDKSFYKTSPLGNEAATKSFGANVITHTITGKTYFVAWSMDVKFEGKNVDRHMDMTTSNHNPPPGGTGPTGCNIGKPIIPGQRLPNQTCMDAELDKLQKEKDQICGTIPGGSMSDSKVSPKKLAKIPCSVIKARIKAQQNCLAKRQEIQDECFGGQPDPVHQKVLAQMQEGIATSQERESINCAPGHPMANR